MTGGRSSTPTSPPKRGGAASPLQYWFFYYFNEFNNLHEGDWEMIQLLFDADSVEEALAQEPVAVAFAQHSGGETADWDAPKLEKKGCARSSTPRAARTPRSTDPGSGSAGGRTAPGSAATSPTAIRCASIPRCASSPTTIDAADDPFAWVTFGGRWGERETWVYDGPTGPALKTQWTAPVTWMEGLRADSIRVNATGLAGPAPSDIFCEVVEDASALLTLFKPYPLLVIGIVAPACGLAVWALRQSWSNLGATWRVYRANFRVLAGTRRHHPARGAGR